MIKLSVQVFVALLVVSEYGVNTLKEDQLQQFPSISKLFIATTTKYRALADSARIQHDLNVQSQHARLISRIAFLVEELMNSEREISDDIRNRAIEINNNNTECILNAQRDLHSSSVLAGDSIRFVSKELREEIDMNNEKLVNPVLQIIDAIVSQLEIETFVKLGYLNSVTEMDFLLELFAIELKIGESLFEGYVDKIIADFIASEVKTSEMNARMFPRLDRVLEDYRFSGILIRNSLDDCNE